MALDYDKLYHGHIDWAKLGFSEELKILWGILRQLLTTCPLGLTPILSRIREWIDCDAVLLMSRDEKIISSGPAYWRTIRSAKRTAHDDSKLDLRKLAEDTKFHSLLDHFLKIGIKAYGKATYQTALVDYQSSQVLDNLTFYSEALKELQKLEENKMRKEDFDNLTLNIGGKLGIAKAYLLGHVQIGDWDIGESQLIMLNEFSESDKELDGVRRLDDLNIFPSLVAFSIYLAVVNSHFWHLKSIETRSFSARIIQATKESEIWDSFKIRIERIIPLLGWNNGRDIWRTISALTEIFEQLKIKDNSENNIENEIKKDLLALRTTSEDSYYCIRDEFNPPSALEKSANRNRVQSVWDWSELFQEVNTEVLKKQRQVDLANDKDQISKDESDQQKVKRLCDRTDALLNKLPAVLFPISSSSLLLEGRSLTGFFLCRLYEWQKNQIISPDSILGRGNEFVGIVEKLVYIKNLAVTVLFALGAREADSNTLQALLWLLSEFGHEALGLDRRLDLEKHLQLAAMEQPALYGLKPFYRDHLNHVLQVCLSGWLLLDTNLHNGKKQALWKIIAKQKKYPTNEDGYKMILQQWFLAALLHDIGYIIEVGTGWSALLKLFKDPILEELQAGISREIKKLSQEVLKKQWGFSENDKPGEDHGVISALHLSEVINALKNDELARTLEPAIIAMAHHSHWRPQIHFKDEPLSALLIIADELQEWDRPGIDFNKVGLALSAAIVNRAVGENEWYQPLSSIKANLKIKWSLKNGISSEVTGSVLSFEIKYRADIHRQDGLFAAWLGRSANLQKIKLADNDFEVCYALISTIIPPADLDRRDRSQTQMERLKQLIREKRLWPINNWVPKQRLATAPSLDSPAQQIGVEYFINIVGDQEFIRLNVKALGKNPPIQLSMDSFWNEATNWSGAFEGRSRIV